MKIIVHVLWFYFNFIRCHISLKRDLGITVKITYIHTFLFASPVTIFLEKIYEWLVVLQVIKGLTYFLLFL